MWEKHSHGVTPKRPRKRPHKTQKRLAAKRTMLAAKKSKKRR